MVGLALVLLFIGCLALAVALTLRKRANYLIGIGQLGGSGTRKDLGWGSSTTERALVQPDRAEVAPVVLPAPARTEPPARFELASLTDVLPWLQQAHHIAIIGGTGDGKTWLGEALVRLLGDLYCVIDPNWEPSKWAGLDVISTGEEDDFEEIRLGLVALQSEMVDRRKNKLNGEWGEPDDTGSYPNPPPVLHVFWDEVNETMEELKPFSGVVLRRALRRWRQYRVKLILYLQSDRVGALGLEGHGDALKNLVWVYVGGDAREQIEKLQRSGSIDMNVSRTLIASDRPCVIKWKRDFFAVDLGTVPELRKQSVTARSWMPAKNGGEGSVAETALDEKHVLELLETMTDSQVAKSLPGGKGRGYVKTVAEVRRIRGSRTESVPSDTTRPTAEQ